VFIQHPPTVRLQEIAIEAQEAQAKFEDLRCVMQFGDYEPSEEELVDAEMAEDRFKNLKHDFSEALKAYYADEHEEVR
jgi:hypothetical protein